MAANDLTGGGFQDSAGNVLANGRMILVLSAPARDTATSAIQICNGFECEIPLDAEGNIVSGNAMWPNDLLTPSGTYYMARVNSDSGELSWGPNAVTISSTPSPFNVGVWVPGNPA